MRIERSDVRLVMTSPEKLRNRRARPGELAMANLSFPDKDEAKIAKQLQLRLDLHIGDEDHIVKPPL
jgi:hypothetical protein